MLWFFFFSCSFLSAITNEQQEQQHSKVTTTTTTTKQNNSWKFKISYLMSTAFSIAFYRISSWCSTSLGGMSACLMHSQLHSSECQDDLMWYCSRPPDASSEGYICLSTAFPRMSRCPYAATRCLYWGVHLPDQCILNCILQNVKMTLCSTALGQQMLLQRGRSACVMVFSITDKWK